MTQVSPHNNRPSTDPEDGPSTSLEAWLEEMSQELDPTKCDDLFELGIYSIHEHSTARTITLPEGADEFGDATTVKQYYYEGYQCPLLIVAPLRL